MSYENILVDQQDRVGIITLNRPDVLNALNLQLVTEVNEAVSAMEVDEKIVVF